MELQAEVLELEDRRSKERVRNMNEQQKQFMRAVDGQDNLLDNVSDLVGLVTMLVEENPHIKGLDDIKPVLSKYFPPS